MIAGFTQTDSRLKREIRKWGCLFLSMAHLSPVHYDGEDGIRRLNEAWDRCVAHGGITGDLDGDGNADGDGESEVRDYSVVLRELCCPLRYDGFHRKPGDAVPEGVRSLIGCYRWRGTHFVVLDRNTGAVVFDPMGKSNTVRFGVLESIRWFYDN